MQPLPARSSRVRTPARERPRRLRRTAAPATNSIRRWCGLPSRTPISPRPITRTLQRLISSRDSLEGQLDALPELERRGLRDRDLHQQYASVDRLRSVLWLETAAGHRVGDLFDRAAPPLAVISLRGH